MNNYYHLYILSRHDYNGHFVDQCYISCTSRVLFFRASHTKVSAAFLANEQWTLREFSSPRELFVFPEAAGVNPQRFPLRCYRVNRMISSTCLRVVRYTRQFFKEPRTFSRQTTWCDAKGKSKLRLLGPRRLRASSSDFDALPSTRLAKLTRIIGSSSRAINW